MASIAKTLISAMEEVAQKAVEKAGYDKTRVCQILSTANSNNTYTVSVDGIEYKNISCDGSGSFEVGDVTKIYIPNGQMSQAYLDAGGGGGGSIPASSVTAGTFAGKVVSNATAVSTLTDSQNRNIYFGTTDMTPGTTTLATGDMYFVYE